MLRSALLLGAGIAAALAFACVPPPAAAPPVGPAGGSVAVLNACLSDFASNKVQIINFDPTSDLLHDPPSGPSAAGSTYAADLNAAFALAPSSFRRQLCDLTGVFINEQSCNLGDPCALNNSWGLRDSTRRNSQNDLRYIAISAALWGAGNGASSHHVFENFLFDNLLDWSNDNGKPRHVSTGLPAPTSRAMAILAALAHEYGHVLWNVTNNPARAPNFDPSGFCQPTTNFFSGWASLPGAQLAGWRLFGDVRGMHAAAKGADISTILQDIPNDSRPPYRASVDVDTIYAVGSPWPSLFAAFSPEEDFVETFKLAVLINASTPLQHEKMQFLRLKDANGHPIVEDIPWTLNQGQRPELSAKIACFGVQP